MQKIPLLVIFAPTASGKTALVEKLFSDYSDSVLAGKAEIISADSMQFYRHLDIGTAKPNPQFLQHLPHHLIDIVDYTEQFGAGSFLPLADRASQEIFSRHRLPVLCGGTAFYIKNFLYGLPQTPECDLSLRTKIQERIKKEGAKKLHEELSALDPESAEKIHVNDEYRIQRALEIILSTGKKRTELKAEEKLREKYDFFIIQLLRPKEELYKRINARVEEMFLSGLEKEFNELEKNGAKPQMPGMQAIGYREFFQARDKKYLHDLQLDDENLSYSEKVCELIKRDTRHYAKKQLTFFSRLAGVNKFDAEDFSGIERAVLEWLNNCSNLQLL